MKQLALLNPENATEEEVKDYSLREAVRAVVVDEDGKIALLYVSKHSYYKLPGGGMESGEDNMSALERECKEEIGCDVKVMSEIGSIAEYRKFSNSKTISYCYLAKVKGKKETPNFTESEKERGFEQVWLPFNEALKVLEENRATIINGKLYIVPRDTIFLKEAKNLLYGSPYSNGTQTLNK